MSEAPADVKTIRYVFVFADGARYDFDIRLDRATLEMQVPAQETPPDWTRLSYMKCPNCPLDEVEHPRCPVARNMVGVVDLLKDRLSYEEADVTVEMEGRTYSKRTALQNACSSLIGIYTVSSGCPVLGKMRPMVDTHLPFMTPDESTYRLIAMYLTAQYFMHKWGQPADWELANLVRFLGEARETNAAFCHRLQSLGIKDAMLNAVANLNAMGEMTSMTIELADLERLEAIFAQHYKE